MTTQEILLLLRRIHELTSFCRDEPEWNLSNEDYIEIYNALIFDSNCVDYLSQGEKVRPVAMLLRESLKEFLDCTTELLDKVKTQDYDDVKNQGLYMFDTIVDYSEKWISWIDQYFPPVKAATHQKNKSKSKAAALLQSQELQEVKSKLIAAGIIVDGVWQGTPAEFGCLVNELRDERGINDHGRRAWKEVAKWAGYDGNLESARSAIEKHIDTGGDVADNIRVICLANK